MTGTQLYNLLIQILGGEQIDQTYALSLFNLARYDMESRRMWRCLVATDTSLTAPAGENVSTAYNLNSPLTPSQSTPYFMQFLLEGGLVLVNTANTNQTMGLVEIAPEYRIGSKGAGAFYVDYVNRKFYILANLSFAAQINQYFIADYGDITLTTSWVGFPPRFGNALVFQAAARYRLGTDYDDIAARNAEENYKASEDMYKAMVRWDANLALNAYQHRPFSSRYGGSGGYQGSYPPPNNGGYAGGLDYGW